MENSDTTDSTTSTSSTTSGTATGTSTTSTTGTSVDNSVDTSGTGNSTTGGTSTTTGPTGTAPLLTETPDVQDTMMGDGYEYHLANGALYSGTTTGSGTSTTGTTSGTSTTGSTTGTTTTGTTTSGTGATSGTSTTGTTTTTGTGTTVTQLQGSDAHHNFLEGGSDDAVIHAGSAGDILVGGTGTSNTLVGGTGDDTMIGGSSANTTNTLNGGNGTNTLVAAGTLTQETSDLLHANESVVTALDNDPMLAAVAALANGTTTASNVSNVFQVQSGTFHDDIYNFHASSDVVQIQSNINGSGITNVSTLLQHVTVSGNDLSIDVGGGSTVTLVGVDVQHLTAHNVAFV